MQYITLYNICAVELRSAKLRNYLKCTTPQAATLYIIMLKKYILLLLDFDSHAHAKMKTTTLSFILARHHTNSY